MIYTLTLNPAIDYVVQLGESLKAGTIHRNAAESVQYGGKGINVSNVLRTLGQETVALGFVAGFTGEGLEKGLKAMGLKTRFVHLKEGMTRINVKIKAEEETEINGRGPVITEEALEQLYVQLDRLEDDDMLVLSGSVPAGLPDDTYEKVAARLQGRRVRLVVDAAGTLLRKTLKYRPFLIKPNRQELEEFFGKTGMTEEELAAGALTLQRMGAGNVLISLAEEGALLLDEAGQLHRTGCPKGKVVNSVGAGDSMVAGFLAGYRETGDYGYALALGTAAGSATAFCLGLAERRQIEALLNTVI